jgi:hypothetical protein
MQRRGRYRWTALVLVLALCLAGALVRAEAATEDCVGCVNGCLQHLADCRRQCCDAAGGHDDGKVCVAPTSPDGLAACTKGCFDHRAGCQTRCAATACKM